MEVQDIKKRNVPMIDNHEHHDMKPFSASEDALHTHLGSFIEV